MHVTPLSSEVVLSVTTPPNPEQLLRRPKKPVANTPNTGMLAAGAVGALLVVGAIVAFVVFGHGKSAAGSAAQTAQITAVPVSQGSLPVFAPAPVIRSGHKPAAPAKPTPGISPTPAPTATPNAAPTPGQPHPATAAQAAKLRHEAALHAAALRREQAAALNGGSSAVSLGNSSVSPAGQTIAQTQPAAIPTPAPASPTPDAQPTPVYAPLVVVDARFIDRVSPSYPDIAREQGASGTAIVLATVGSRGNVISVAIDQSTGNRLLDQAALSAARSSRFEPPEIDGKPATETYRIVYTFDPNS